MNFNTVDVTIEQRKNPYGKLLCLQLKKCLGNENCIPMNRFLGIK